MWRGIGEQNSDQGIGSPAISAAGEDCESNNAGKEPDLHEGPEERALVYFLRKVS